MDMTDNSRKIDELLANVDSRFLHKTVDDVVLFVESDKEAKLNTMSISGFQKVVPIDQDKFTLAPTNLFNFKNYSKTCDGIFFGIVDTRPIILVFDVKSSRKNTTNHIFKMKAGINFVNYVKSTLQIFSEIDYSDFECYFCIFYLEFGNGTKTSLRMETSQDPNAPIYIPVNNGDVINIRRVLGLKLI